MFTNKRDQHAWETAVERGAGTWQDEWTRQAICACRKAVLLTVAFSPMGYWTIGLVLKSGHMIGDPAVDAVVQAVGLVEAVSLLARCAHRVLKNGQQKGPGVNVATVKYYQDEIEH